MTGPRPRLALVCHYLPPHEGGIERVVARLEQEYQALGWDVVTIAWGRGDPAPSTVALTGWNGLERHGVPVPLVEPVSTWRRIGRALADVDAVHVQGLCYPACVVALAQARRHRLPAIVTEHVGTVPYDRLAFRVVQAVALRLTARAAARSVRAATVLNERVGEEMGRLMPSVPIAKIPNGVDSTRFSPASAADHLAARDHFGLDRPTVLGVGRHVPKKGLDRLAAAARGGQAGFDVLLVGRGTTALAGPGVKTIEALDQAELARLYQAVDLLALPSEGEGVPLVVQEALASGLPVIMGDDPAVRAELPEGPVTFVAARDPGAFGEAIDQLLADPGQLARLADEARNEALRRFDWQTSARHYLELLGVAAAGEGPGRGPTGPRVAPGADHRVARDPESPEPPEAVR